MNLEQIIIQTLIEYQFGDNLKNGDYITGVKKMYFGEVAAMVVKKYNDIHIVSNHVVYDECGDTGRGKPTLQEPDGIDCEKCSSK